LAPRRAIEEPERPALKVRLRASVAQTRAALGLVWSSSPRGTIAIAVLTVFASLLPPAVAYVGKWIIDAVVDAVAAPVGPLKDEATRQALIYVGIELGLVAATAAVERALSLTRSTVGARLGSDVNVRILDKALSLDLVHFEDSEIYDKLTRARQGASSRPLSLVMAQFEVAKGLLSLAGYMGLLLAFSPWMVLAVLAASIPAFISEARFSQAAYKLRSWRSPETRKLFYLERVLASDEHAKEVKLLDIGKHLLGRYAEMSEKFVAEDRKLQLRRAAWGFVFAQLGSATFYVCYALVALAAIAGRLTLGGMTLYLVAFKQAQSSFASVLGAIGGMYEDSLYVANLFEFLSIPTTETQAPPEGLAELDERGLRFEGVGFRYPGVERWAVRDVSFFVPAGGSLALVGENGAGKTTLVKLLTRLYEPTEGRVLLDGKDLRAWDEHVLRRRIGVLFQDFGKYQLALRENVAFGDLPKLQDDDALHEAVDRGGATDIVARAPAGLDSQLGKWFKGGVDLSGGEWQRIALARALVRKDASVVVLDEPTSALDAQAEHRVFERLREMAAGRIAVFVSHRYATVRRADQILVLDRGAIVERGTHEELVAIADGRYAHAFRLQAEGYR
jgi:ATP-binding cassette subfamily B protein